MSRSQLSTLPRLVALAVVTLIAIAPDALEAQAGVWGGELVARIDSLAEATLREGPVAGLTIGVKRGADLLLVKGYGLADIENVVPATAETVYRIGSLTKHFTGATIMQLVDSGRLALDDPITRYLPHYPTQGHEVTIRHLLTHTSGIWSYTNLGEPFFSGAARLDLSREDMLALFQDEPFDFAPGERFGYSNSNYSLLGVILEEVTGVSYADYLQTNVFDALGLTRSSYCYERQIVPGRAEGYERVEGVLLNDAPISMYVPGPAGALCSTVPDLLSCIAALRTGRVVSPASYAAMTASAELLDGSTTEYGFGLAVETLGEHPVVWHNGLINGFVSMMAHYPESQLDIVVELGSKGV
jgi:D-alanyl-D-alanine carboxypeptidase